MIGVIAADKTRAQHLITELRIPYATILTNTPRCARGMTLDLILFDETACPPHPDVLEAAQAAVPNGRVYQLQRIP